jgi:dihydrolipoamide dehydrogenase
VVPDGRRIITSDEAIGMREVPKSIVILGAGAIGVEFGTLFRRLGSEVTIVELLPRIVPLEDEAVSAELEKSFRRQGIRVHTGSQVTRAEAGTDGVVIDARTADGKTISLGAWSGD